MQADELFMRDVLDEVVHLRRRVPNAEGLLAETLNEADELNEACREGSSNLIYVEAVQLCAAAMRLALEGDKTLDSIRVANRIAIFRGQVT